MNLFKKKAKASNNLNDIKPSDNTLLRSGMQEIPPIQNKQSSLKSNEQLSKTKEVQKKKLPKAVIIVGVVVWLLIMFLAVSFVVAKFKGDKQPTQPNQSNQTSVNEQIQTPITDAEKVTTPSEGNTEIVDQAPNKGNNSDNATDSHMEGEGVGAETTPNNKDSEFGSYENNLLQVKLQYPGKWFFEERSDLILNTVKVSSVENKFDILKNPLEVALPFLTLKADDIMNTVASLTFIPQETLFGTTISTLDATALTKINEQVKGLPDVSLTDFTSTYTKDIGGINCAVTEFSYTPLGNKISAIQVYVPYGANTLNILITSKAGPTSIDKMVVLEGIVRSLKVGVLTTPDR